MAGCWAGRSTGHNSSKLPSLLLLKNVLCRSEDTLHHGLLPKRLQLSSWSSLCSFASLPLYCFAALLDPLFALAHLVALALL